MARKKTEKDLLQEPTENEVLEEKDGGEEVPSPNPNDGEEEIPPGPNSQTPQESGNTPTADPAQSEQPGAEKNQTAGADTRQEPPTPQNDPPPKETETPKSGNTPNPLPNGKKRIRHESLKNEAVSVFDGTLILFDETGTAEIDAPYADYLLHIPSYSEVTT